MKEAGFDPPGVKGAPTNTAGAMWKLCRTSYPNVSPSFSPVVISSV